MPLAHPEKGRLTAGGVYPHSTAQDVCLFSGLVGEEREQLRLRILPRSFSLLKSELLQSLVVPKVVFLPSSPI